VIIAVDSGVRITNCYSYATRRIEKVGVAVTGVITDSGVVDLLEYRVASPETRDVELEMVRLYADRAEICIYDGLPERICQKNLGVIKTGRPIEGWLCTQYGPYAICADFDLSTDLIRKAIEMNATVHRIVHRRAKTLFEYELAKRKCVTATGIHVVSDLSYYYQK
jgi:hypothetical protein